MIGPAGSRRELLSSPSVQNVPSSAPNLGESEVAEAVQFTYRINHLLMQVR